MNRDDFNEIQEAREDLERESEARPASGQQPAKIQFTAEQQEKVNQLIREAQGRAAKEVRAELTQAQARLKALESTPPEQSGAGAAEIATQLAVTKAELDAMRRERAEAAISAELVSIASSENFHDPHLAARLMRDHVRIGEDGRATVVDADGCPRLNSELNPMTPAEFAREMATQKPFLVRSSVRPGVGSVESRGPVDRHSLEKLFGPNAEPGAAAKLNKIAQRDQKAYRALREAARAKGLI